MSSRHLRTTLETIRASLLARPPFFRGTCPASSDQCALHYRTVDVFREINLSSATEAELEALTNACQPAMFGRNEEDVYDESYRKAWKMDESDFMTNFSPHKAGLVDAIRSELLGRADEKRPINLELYKLNVYGKGSFFKPHKDTPRSERMFGSLVVIFPTPYEGGEFILRHGGEEWELESVQTISAAAQSPPISFIAFFSDVEHEVMEVTSGYRVTLTYNLYFAETEPLAPSISTPSPQEDSFRIAIADLVANPAVLPGGGYLGFGLQHQYPVSRQMSVESLRTCLKGQDAAIARVLDSLSLKWHLRICYCATEKLWEQESHFLSEFVLELGQYANMSAYDNLLPDLEYVLFVCDSPTELYETHRSEYGYHDNSEDKYSKERRLLPVTPIPPNAQPVSKYINYGNQAIAGKLYADICLVAEAPVKVPRWKKPGKMAQAEYCKKDIFSEDGWD
ncbi:hypothetical protein PAXINDRAFT_103518 [Paxillus involutus ATCC 200175]|uniref:Fe2OG dioxygenase domain-containing protein n=1 Tax=Paxillus involutus ATCC 200175 TaxID=664439 RepID=A0A0C9SMF5_PAXIN|nr:hypothetical protein PAXINDRAFT_103518 [Paxillus involutus ATCC 200175]